MEEKKEPGCSSVIGIVVCLLISLVVIGPLANYIGFLAYPLIVAGGFGLAKITEPIWYKGNKK